MIAFYWSTVALMFSIHVWVGGQWLLLNQRIAKGLCCGFTEPVLEEMYRKYDLTLEPWTLNRGLSPRAGEWFLSYLGESGLLTLTLLSMVASMLITLVICHRLKKSWWGIWAAGIVPILPYCASMVRRWDVYALQMPLILLALWCVLESRRLTRFIPTLIYFACLIAAAFFSSRETDNLLLLMTLLSIGGASFGAGLWTRKDRSNVSINRLKSVLMCMVLGAMAILFIVTRMSPSSPEGWAYYAAESAQPLTIESITAYVKYIALRGMGPWFLGVLTLAVVSLLLFRKLPAPVTGGVLIPLFVLSLLPKKNHYYISSLWPMIPVFCALALSSLPKFVSIPAAGWSLLLGSMAYFGHTLPGYFEHNFASKRQWISGHDRQEGAFQTSDNQLSIAPVLESPAHEIVKDMRGLAPSKCPYRLQYTGSIDIGEIQVRMAIQEPCARIQRFNRGIEADQYWAEGIQPPDTSKPLLKIEVFDYEEWGEVRVYQSE